MPQASEGKRSEPPVSLPSEPKQSPPAVAATADDDVERTAEDGKASSVHFLLFHFSDRQVEKFRAPGAEIVLSVGHENYRHMAVLPAPMRLSLAADFT